MEEEVFDHHKIELMAKHLGIDFQALYLAKYAALKNGREIVKFIVPAPKLSFQGLPIVFADVSTPTVEVKP